MSTNSKHFKNKANHDAETFRLLLECANRFSPKEFKENLKSLLSKHYFERGNATVITNYIIKCVLKEYNEHGITREDLVNTAKRGYVHDARKICIILIKKNIKITGINLTKYFAKKTPEIVYKTIREHNKLDRKSKSPAIQDFIKRYDSVEEKVSKYLFELKTKKIEVDQSNEN